MVEMVIVGGAGGQTTGIAPDAPRQPPPLKTLLPFLPAEECETPRAPPVRVSCCDQTHTTARGWFLSPLSFFFFSVMHDGRPLGLFACS